MLRVELLGKVAISVSGQPMKPLRGKSGLWLLGILAMNANQRVERNWLAGVLWPESAPEAGRANLRRALTDLRAALGVASECLESPTPQSLRLALADDATDVLLFRAGALERYGGELLPGCDLEWVETERRVLAEEFLARGEAQVAALLPSGEALALLERLRAVDPLRESLLRLQLAALCGQGNRAEAQQVYHRFRRLLLESRLGEPSAQTQAHWAALKESPAPEESPAASSSATLPAPLNPLLGRQSERDALLRLLESHRLVTLTGLGGVGKTRLAIEVARTWPTETRFLELAECRDVAALTETLETCLASCADDDGPLLFVLDNFEQLVGADARRALRGVLEKRPNLRCLVTSRRALGIVGERLFPLEPLELPRHTGSMVYLSEFASVQLLVERAHALRPSFALTEENAPDILALCERAEGIPLALELAAAHLRSLSPGALLARMTATRLPLLARRDDGEMQRHQSLWKIVESSVALLDEKHRTGFRKLSVLRGGWTLEAAAAIYGLSGPLDALALLEALEEASLIRTNESGRYSQLEILREFGDASLSPSERAAARAAHARFFLDFAERHAGPGDVAALHAERGNLEATMEILLSQGDTAAALRWARASRWYWYHRIGGQSFLKRLLEQLTDPAERADIQESLGTTSARYADYDQAHRYLAAALDHAMATNDTLAQAKILTNRATLRIDQGDMEEARRELEEALPLWRRLNHSRGLGAALNNLSLVATNLGDLAAAETFIDESLALRTAQDDSFGYASVLINRGALELRQVALVRAEATFREALRRFVEVGDQRGEGSALEGLAEVFLDRGDLTEALRFMEEAIWLRREYQLAASALQLQLDARFARLKSSATVS